MLQAAVPSGCTITLSQSVVESAARNVTVPVGVPEPGEFTVTVAVRVDVPDVGSVDDVKAVVVDAWFTFCDDVPVLPPLIGSPA